MTTITAEQIAKLEKANGHRWTKGNHDRIYFNATDIGLKVEYYKSGNISSASFDGEYVSNSEAGRVLAAKMYVEVSDGSIHTSFGRISRSIEESLTEKLNAIVADAMAPEVEEAKTEKQLVKLVWGEQWVGEDGDHCSVVLVMANDEDCQPDSEDLADHPGDWQTEDPYIDAEDALLRRNGLTRDNVVEIITPW